MRYEIREMRGGRFLYALSLGVRWVWLGLGVVSTNWRTTLRPYSLGTSTLFSCHVEGPPIERGALFRVVTTLYAESLVRN